MCFFKCICWWVNSTYIFRQIFEESSNIKCRDNPSRGSRVVPSRRTDGMAGRKTGMTTQVVAFRNFATEPKTTLPNGSVIWKPNLKICFKFVILYSHVTSHVTPLTVIRKRHLTFLHSSLNIKKKKILLALSPFAVPFTNISYLIFDVSKRNLSYLSKGAVDFRSLNERCYKLPW